MGKNLLKYQYHPEIHLTKLFSRTWTLRGIIREEVPFKYKILYNYNFPKVVSQMKAVVFGKFQPRIINPLVELL